MAKKRKIMASIMATMLFTVCLVGCGEKSPSGNNGTDDKKQLTVWSHLTQPEVDEINKVAQIWAEKNNIKVKVVKDDSEMQQYIQAANSSKGPDVYFGLAHDNLGTGQKAGILEEVPEGFIDESKYASKQLIDAVTLQGKKYAVPIAQETVAMFYNKDLVNEMPKTMEELIKIAKDKGFKYDVNDFYKSYGFIAANGGYVYKNNNGTLDSTDIGLNNEGAVKGYEFIESLVKDKLIAPDINNDLAKGEFIAGKAAFYISGPWDVSAAQEARLNFDVSPMPTLNENKIPTFMGVQAAFVSAKSENKELAWDLLKYLVENTGDVLVEKGNRIPVLNQILSSEKFKENKYMAAFSEQAKYAHPMPNIPEVQAMWTPGAENIKLLLAGQLSPKEAADKTVEQIKEGIAQQK
ncbi:maltose ABC transporter substrate-binding protein [Clostridium tarantellae]|uniref:Maltodextrin-binding protein n=1 Tax=Clostridium tarantellae TaxID=39493 RepID=A0A6I1MQJ7_9CLOT|nr:maltose ABC transporter substrate-binding protein [Clostridium tarantellae]MPQ44522.1 extracellular solute-binding protein [Clostridium tarantellae]